MIIKKIVCDHCGKEIEYFESKVRIHFCNKICKKEYYLDKSIMRNEVRYDGNLAYVKAKSNSGEYQEFIVDKESIKLMMKYNWRIQDGYVSGRAYDKEVKLHRFLTNCPNGKLVDHINRITLDNRLENLRVCNCKVNSRNRSVSSKSISGYNGINWNSKKGCWRVRIKVNKKNICIGNYFDLEQAKIARYNAEIKYWGESYQFNKEDFKIVYWSKDMCFSRR